ncbi:2Fe-2S iron-sulfur cluster-binding protein [Flavobacterium kingsejongi]|uniref:2Fe-2S iron-sulfur cluster-binding protein n=1 Tax=Flavobacterium kingsejongi TaxID=1678728 RepID=UPI001D130E21
MQRKKELVSKTKSSERTVHTTYKVRLTNPRAGLNTTIEVLWHDYILNAAEEQGIDLPYSCRCGADSSSLAKQLSGSPADQSEQTFLNEEQIDAGWVLLDVASPTSDCTFLTHQEENLY